MWMLDVDFAEELGGVCGGGELDGAGDCVGDAGWPCVWFGTAPDGAAEKNMRRARRVARSANAFTECAPLRATRLSYFNG